MIYIRRVLGVAYHLGAERGRPLSRIVVMAQRVLTIDEPTDHGVRVVQLGASNGRATVPVKKGGA
jgi:hypothetical protein